MSSDQPRRSRVTRNLRLTYEDVAAEPIPEKFQVLLRRLDDDDLDPRNRRSTTAASARRT
jgi:hypothetical protein